MKSGIVCLCAAVVCLLSVSPLVADDYDLDELHAISEKYRDVNVALADGYIRDPANHCITAASVGYPAELGAMGIHYLHPAFLDITGDKPRVDGTGTHTDFRRPAILIYEPQADGSLVLVAIENLVFEDAWHAAGHAEAPMINGRHWDHMIDHEDTPADEAHDFMPHFDQHVWLHRDNPAGTLEPFNVNVTCEHHQKLD